MSISIKIMQILSKLRVSAGWVFFILIALIGKVQNFWPWPLLLIIGGESIRTIAAGTIKKNEILATSGIYGNVRHPLYFGSSLISLGFCLMCNNIFLWTYFFIFFPLCYGPAIFLEETYLESRFGERFQKYRQTVPAFMPFRIRKMDLKNNLSLRLIFENREHHNWLILLITVLVLVLKIKFMDISFR